MIDKTDPQALESDFVRGLLERQVADGRLPLETLTDQGSLPKGWTLPNYREVFTSMYDPGKPTYDPTAPGAGTWKDPIKAQLRKAEGFRSVAYDDVARGAAARSVGYGFNLVEPGIKALVQKTLGLSAGDMAALHAGKRQMSVAEGEQVLDALIETFNGEVSRGIGNKSLTAGQRTALVDLAYNSGSPRLAKLGIFDAIKRGDTDGLMNIVAAWPVPKDRKTGKPLKGVSNRRKLMAMEFAGPKFSQFASLFD